MEISNFPKKAKIETITNKISELEGVYGIPEFACGNHWNSWKRYILVITQTHLYSLNLRDAAVAEVIDLEDITAFAVILASIEITVKNKKIILGNFFEKDKNQLIEILSRRGKDQTSFFQEIKDGSEAAIAEFKSNLKDLRGEKNLSEHDDPEGLNNTSIAQQYGKVRAKCMFGANVVTIYENGFVRVSKSLGLMKGDIEELIEIFGESDITKKTGLGRAVGGVFTLGANLMLSPNQRGNLYLTIATNKRTHSLIWERPSNTAISEMNKLVAAGKAVIKIKELKEEKVTGKETLQDINPLDQLKKLKELLEVGAITEAEFNEKKVKLLGEI